MGGYRLGLDIGANSIGWAVLDLDSSGRPNGLRDLGVRIYPDGRDPQSGTSLAVERRTARGQRRRRDRYLRRRADLMDALVRHGLMPAETGERKALESLDPYELRARGLDEALPLAHLGRAIFHLGQRRGFKSNRQAEGGDDEDPGAIKAARDALNERLEQTGARTLGEYLWWQHERRAPVRARPYREGKKTAYPFYPGREMIEDEFERLWAAQASHHRDTLTEAARAEIRGILFRQRPLKPVDPGVCTLNPSEARAPWALPTAQRFRILQDLANLRVVRADQSSRPLTAAEHAKALERLRTSRDVKFEQLAKLLKLADGERFNMDTAARKNLKSDETANVLAHKSRFAKAWHRLDLARQDEVVEKLLAAEEDSDVIAWLREAHGLDAEAAQAVADAKLPKNHCHLGRTALSRIVPIMAECRQDSDKADPETGEVLTQPITYDKAVIEAGLKHHADFRPDILPYLPYYGEVMPRHVLGGGDPAASNAGRYGRIPNPTVHIGLNQVRRVVNAIIRTHGPPAEIVVELARELKQSRERAREWEAWQARNRAANDRRRQDLASLGMADNGENRLKLRLWEELNPDNQHDRRCPYTDEQISIGRLLSDEVEIDHILPFKRTLDNSAANKVVCLRRANREKRNQSPAEAFKETPQWPAILERAQKLPPNKRWRFAEDAMGQFKAGFLDRHLTDTAYLSRVVKAYLGHVCDPDRVRVTPGRLTAMLRGFWGLNGLLSDHNQKTRTDQRHHAVDAFVVALTDQGMLQKVASAADEERERLIQDMPAPWDGFRDDLRARLGQIIVSYKPEHGTQGKLHEATALGPVRDPAQADGHNVVYRKAFADLKETEIARIRDPHLREDVAYHVRQCKADGLSVAEALASFNAEREAAGRYPVRRVRLLDTKGDSNIIGIRDYNGTTYKYYASGDNHHIDIFETQDGEWRGEVQSVFKVNQQNNQPAWPRYEPQARLVMRLHKQDLIRLDKDDGSRIFRVVQIRPDRLILVEHHEGGNLEKRYRDKTDPFKYEWPMIKHLPRMNARRVVVDELGRPFVPPRPA